MSIMEHIHLLLHQTQQRAERVQVLESAQHKSVALSESLRHTQLASDQDLSLQSSMMKMAKSFAQLVERLVLQQVAPAVAVGMTHQLRAMRFV